tara:strand:+ start:1046 stop:1525 length:480 start_codon:yes stop_codon:yes gene_type:complete
MEEMVELQMMNNVNRIEDVQFINSEMGVTVRLHWDTLPWKYTATTSQGNDGPYSRPDFTEDVVAIAPQRREENEYMDWKWTMTTESNSYSIRPNTLTVHTEYHHMVLNRFMLKILGIFEEQNTWTARERRHREREHRAKRAKHHNLLVHGKQFVAPNRS